METQLRSILSWLLAIESDPQIFVEQSSSGSSSRNVRSPSDSPQLQCAIFVSIIEYFEPEQSQARAPPRSPPSILYPFLDSLLPSRRQSFSY